MRASVPQPGPIRHFLSLIPAEIDHGNPAAPGITYALTRRSRRLQSTPAAGLRLPRIRLAPSLRLVPNRSRAFLPFPFFPPPTALP